MRKSSVRTSLCLVFIISVTSIIISLSIHPNFEEEEAVFVYSQRHLLSEDQNGTTLYPEDASNPNCTPAAIEQFPRPLMSYDIRRNGGLIIHILVSLYMFLGLAIICDEYFVPSLDGICNDWSLVMMAIVGIAFTSLVCLVCFTLSNETGSVNFSRLKDNKEFGHVGLLCLYVLRLEADVAGATFMAAGSSAPELAAAVIAVFIAKDDIGVGTVVGSAVYNIAFVVGICGLFAGRAIYLNWWPLVRDCVFYLISIVALIIVIYNEIVSWPESVALLLLYVAYIAFMFVNQRVEKWVQKLPCPCPQHFIQGQNENSSLVGYKPLSSNSTDSSQSSPTMMEAKESMSEIYSVTYDQEENVFQPPKQHCSFVLWTISLPLHALCFITIPDCRKQRWKKWFVVTFLMSCAWIAGLSYLLVWMITIIGFTLHIPDTVMGLTFLAAGVSVPDAISSLLVARNGFGDMAVSNAVGSNVFDILLCLGLPWFLQTAIVSPGSNVIVRSKGLTYSTISLLSTVLFLLIATYLNNWKLDRKHGIIMMIWYVAFMVMASLYELNIFGDFNPPTCPSNY